jgi:hypothetical protein
VSVLSKRIKYNEYEVKEVIEEDLEMVTPVKAFLEFRVPNIINGSVMSFKNAVYEKGEPHKISFKELAKVAVLKLPSKSS